MSYEQFRNDLAARLISGQLPTDLSSLLAVIDQVAVNYNIERQTTDLALIQDDIPQIVKLHIAALAVENRSKNTISTRLGILRRFFADVRIPYDQVTANDIRAYLFRYRTERGVSDGTLDRIRCNIRVFYSWCVDEEYIQRNPAAKIGTIKYQESHHVALTPIQLETVRLACHDLREKAMIDFLFSTGCRVSEFCSMQIADVDLDAQTVLIRHGKGDKRRMSYLNAEAVISLRAYLSSRSDDCPALFVSERKPAHSLGVSAVQHAVKKIIARTGLQLHITPHVFRATAATIGLRSGMPVEQVQRFLGHSKIDTTLIYARTDDHDVQESHRKHIA